MAKKDNTPVERKVLQFDINKQVRNLEETLQNVNTLKVLQEKTKPKIYRFSMEMTDELKALFNSLYIKFTYKLSEKGMYIKKKDFVTFIFYEYRDYLSANDWYLIPPDTNRKKIIDSLINRRGGRASSGKEKRQVKMQYIGEYFEEEDTFEIFENIVFSIAMQEQMKGFNFYKKAYFFERILNYIQVNFTKVLNNYLYNQKSE